MNSRPIDIPAAAIGGFGGDFPKASVGNYKGVMLCNRPNEFGAIRKTDGDGSLPFNSRVNPGEQLGWNPCQKPVVRGPRKKKTNAVLQRHRKFLTDLENKKV